MITSDHFSEAAGSRPANEDAEQSRLLALYAERRRVRAASALAAIDVDGLPRVFTSHYGALAAIRPPMTAVSISRGKPRWLKGSWLAHLPPGVTGRVDIRLAPTAAALKASRDEYNRSFSTILRSLDPAIVYQELGDAVLLCFCKPGEFCHRRLVAEWFEARLGVIVPELGVPRIDTPMCVTEDYDFYADIDTKLGWLEHRLGSARSWGK